MRKLIYLLWIFMCPFVFGQENIINSCENCHQELDEPLSNPVKLMKTDVHNLPELSCIGCHGGNSTSDDPDVSMSAKNGFIGKPGGMKLIKMCARCHSNPDFMKQFDPNISTDQYQLYLTSRHGQLLLKGDKKVAVCIDCHGVHQIKKSNDPTSMVYAENIADNCGHCHDNKEYFSGYNIETNQVQEYKSSIHAEMLYQKGDLSAPTCNDCHGNHGAIPPGVTAVSNICGTCHFIQSKYFSASPHKAAFDDMELAECEVCHGNHSIQRTSDKMIGVTEPAVCIECHEPSSAGFIKAGEMRKALDSLTSYINEAEMMLGKTKRAGIEVPSEKILILSEAKDALVHSRTLVHTFSLQSLKEKTNEGMQSAMAAKQVGESAMGELKHRRQMLIVMVILTLVVAAPANIIYS